MNKIKILLLSIFFIQTILANSFDFKKDSLPKIDMVKVEQGTYMFRFDSKFSNKLLSLLDRGSSLLILEITI